MKRTTPSSAVRALPAIAVLLCLVAGPAPGAPTVEHADAELALIEALAALRAGQHERAGEELAALTKRRPDFRLARYLHADWLRSRAGVTAAADAEDRSILTEARLRWQHHQNPPPVGAVPDALLRLAPKHEHAVVVDLSAHRLYLFRNDDGRARLVADYYASIGRGGFGKQVEGDLRTPVGVYHINGFKPDASLPELYGEGALTLNYPNAWDRFFGRTGHGIWVHGVPRHTYNRSPLSSEGCVVVANDHLTRLRQHAELGRTPVVFADELQWLTPGEARSQQQAVLTALRDWHHSRLAGNESTANGHYAVGMGEPEANAARGDARARDAAFEGEPADGLQQLSVYTYPGEPDLRMTTFVADSASGRTQRTLFWRRIPDAGWHLVHESKRPL